jgi:hypothetical protein
LLATSALPPVGGVEECMLWTIVVLLVIFWVLGLMFEVASGLIHLLLVIALIIIVMRVLKGKRPV